MINYPSHWPWRGTLPTWEPDPRYRAPWGAAEPRTKERVACEADHMCMCICTASERARAYFFASKKSILRVLVPVFLSVCDAKGGADMGAGMPAKGASGTAMAASLSPPG